MAILEWVGILCLMRDHKSPYVIPKGRGLHLYLNFLNRVDMMAVEDALVPSAESDWVAVGEQ